MYEINQITNIIPSSRGRHSVFFLTIDTSPSRLGDPTGGPCHPRISLRVSNVPHQRTQPPGVSHCFVLGIFTPQDPQDLPQD